MRRMFQVISVLALVWSAVGVAQSVGLVPTPTVAAASAGTVSYGAGGLQSLTPSRILDTRTGVGAPVGKVGAGSTTVLDVSGVGGVPASGVGAVVLNVTVVAPSAASGYVTVFPTGGVRPVVSNVNFTVGRTVPNLVVVKVGVGGSVSLFNSAGDSHLLADVAGWFPENTSPTTSYDLKPGTVVVGPGDVVSVDVLGTEVVLSGSADVPPVDGFLSMAPGAGGGQPVSGRVTAVMEHPDGSATVTLAPASLQDMFNDVEVHEHGPVPVLPIERAVGRGRRTEGFKPECSSSGEVVAGPDLSFSNGSVDFDFSLSGRHAALEASLTVTLTWAVSVTGSFTCTLETPEVPLLVAGPVLFEGEVEGSITVTGEMAGSVSVDVPITVGFVYDHGQLTNTSGLHANGSADIETPTVTATVDVGAKIEAKLFGVGGLGLTSGPVVQIQATPDCVVVTAWAKFVASAEIGRWGLDWEFDLGTIETTPMELYRSQSCATNYWTGTFSYSAGVPSGTLSWNNGCPSTSTYEEAFTYSASTTSTNIVGVHQVAFDNPDVVQSVQDAVFSQHFTKADCYDGPPDNSTDQTITKSGFQPRSFRLRMSDSLLNDHWGSYAPMPGQTVYLVVEVMYDATYVCSGNPQPWCNGLSITGPVLFNFSGQTMSSPGNWVCAPPFVSRVGGGCMLPVQVSADGKSIDADVIAQASLWSSATNINGGPSVLEQAGQQHLVVHLTLTDPAP